MAPYTPPEGIDFDKPLDGDGRAAFRDYLRSRGLSPSTVRNYSSHADMLHTLALTHVQGGTPADEAAVKALKGDIPPESQSLYAAAYRKLSAWAQVCGAAIPPLPRTNSRHTLPPDDLLQAVIWFQRNYGLGVLTRTIWQRAAPERVAPSMRGAGTEALTTTQDETILIPSGHLYAFAAWAGKAVQGGAGPLVPLATGGMEPASIRILNRWVREYAKKTPNAYGKGFTP